MEDKKDLKILIESLKKAHPAISIEYTKDRLLSPLTHVQLKGPGSKDRGFGTDLVEYTAVVKAYMELVEREVLYDGRMKETSNGFAAHLTDEKAIESAGREVIERDALIMCWLAKRSPRWLTKNELTELGFDAVNQINRQIGDEGLEIALGILAKNGTNFVFIGALKGNRTNNQKLGFAIDTKCEQSLTKGLADVFHGALYYYTLYKGRIDLGLPPYKILSASEVVETEHHLDYYLNPENFRPWFFSSSDEPMELPAFELQSEVLRPKFQVAMKLSVAYVHGNQHQEFFVGPTVSKKINFNRTAKAIPNATNFNLELHPLP